MMHAMFNEFHFLRPDWFWAFAPLAILVVLLAFRKRNKANWRSIIDPQLMPHVLVGELGKQQLWPLVLLALIGSLSIVSLAGPAWERKPVPVFKKQAALIIALDLSRSMDSADLKPSRIARARHKLSDILNQRREGQTALIVYAADAFTVTPLTEDTETILSQVASLKTNLMPAQGSRADIALFKAIDLFKQAGVYRGDVLLITDGAEPSRTESAIQSLVAAGHTLSILGIGTDTGAPIVKTGGGFLTDAAGAIVIPKLNDAELRELASLGNGLYRRITTDDSDINNLLFGNMRSLDNNPEKSELQTDSWREEGPWLLLLIIPLAAFAFRRGLLVLALVCLMPLPKNAEAISWEQLWNNQNQQAQKQFQQGNYKNAAENFSDAEWKAAAHYRAGEYEKAIEALEGIKTADALYNKGNAHAQSGQAQEAIQSYESALALNPDHEDAKHNLEILKQQKQKQQSDQNSKDKNSEQSKPEEQNAEDKESEQGDNQNTEDSGEQQNNNQQDQQNQSDPQSQQEGNKQDSQDSKQEDKKADDKDAQLPEQQNEQPPENEAVENLNENKTMDEAQQATEQWLRRIPDDPAGLLRRKFQYQYKQQKQSNKEEQQW